MQREDEDNQIKYRQCKTVESMDEFNMQNEDETQNLNLQRFNTQQFENQNKKNQYNQQSPDDNDYRADTLNNDSNLQFIATQNYNTDDPSLKDMPYQQIFQNIKKIFLSSIAVSLGMLLQFIIISINLHLVGKLNNPIFIDSVGFGYLIMNCTGGFLIIGYNQGLGAFIGRAHGYNNQQLIQQYFSQGLLVYLVVFTLFSFIIFNMASILISIGQHEELAIYTQYFTTSILLGVFFNYFTDLLRNYLNGQQIYAVPMLILSLSTGFHYLIAQYLFEKYGLQGIILATNVTYIFTFLIFIIYMIAIQKIPSFYFNKIFINIKEYIQETSAIAFPVQMDFIAFEVNGIFVGSLQNLEQFAAHLAMANFVSLFYSFPTGLGGALMYLTSNAMGERNVQKAKNYCILGYFLSFFEGIFFFIVMNVYGKQIGQFYLQDEEMLEIFVKIMNIYTICVIADNIQSGISGIVKGIGKANDALIGFTIAYFCIGTPTSCLLGFYFEMEVFGFWYGFDLAIYCVLIFLSVILYKTDFNDQLNYVQYHIESTSQLI